MTRAFWSNVKDFLASVNLMEASGVLEKKLNVRSYRKREICPEMHALAKMAEMAINRQNRQTINKNSNEMAKGPFAKWRF